MEPATSAAVTLGMVLSNDGESDHDWNDAVVSLMMFDQSTD